MFRFIIKRSPIITVPSSSSVVQFHRFHSSCCGGGGSHGHSHGGDGHSHHHHSSHVAELFHPSGSNNSSSSVNPDLQRCRNLTLVGAAVNVVYSALKISLGATGGSVALVADGLHAVVDIASDGVALGSLYLARRQKLTKRCQFPFGTGRAETVGAVLIATILTLGAFSVAWTAIEKLFDYAANPEKQRNSINKNNNTVGGGGNNSSSSSASSPTSSSSSSCSSDCNHDHEKDHTHEQHQQHHGHSHDGVNIFAHEHHFDILKENTEGLALRDRIVWSMLLVASTSIVAKEVLYRLLKKAAEKAGSASTLANAYHHRADALSAALGLGGVVSAACGMELLDAVAGLGVSAVILQLGLRTLKGSVLQFFDYQSGDLKHIRDLAHGTSKMGTSVNVFATRHGLQVVLHGTLLVRKEATSADVAYLESIILEKVTKEYPNILFDVFFKVRPFTVDSHEHKNSAKHHEGKNRLTKKEHKKIASGAKEEEKEDDDEIVTISDLSVALDEVCQFHGISSAAVDVNKESANGEIFKISEQEKKVVAFDGLNTDCTEDLSRCCELFGYELVVIPPKK